ncbi:CLUMA_CG013343, isoform A [Clunio marinus]|uniref:CLUMA_CG013343, isoform A n=1 Tax=Clunio marinus TaxID=568069 RepID=A0A1J1INK1_9DIPT|nr:CLUMA_CG013343, isoform A [Clunio marinus]
MSLIKVRVLALIAFSHLTEAKHNHGGAIGYSFAKFSGPVSGPVKEVHSHSPHHGHTIDYVAKPDYQFEYGVEDPKTQVSQFRKENRQDDAVVGEYSYTDPFGHVRTVKYTADKLHGFRAEIYIDGKLETPQLPSTQPVTSHDQPQEDYKENGDYSGEDE